MTAARASEIRRKLAVAEAFTETYARYEDEHMAIREARCLAALPRALIHCLIQYTHQ